MVRYQLFDMPDEALERCPEARVPGARPCPYSGKFEQWYLVFLLGFRERRQQNALRRIWRTQRGRANVTEPELATIITPAAIGNGTFPGLRKVLLKEFNWWVSGGLQLFPCSEIYYLRGEDWLFGNSLWSKGCPPYSNSFRRSIRHWILLYFGQDVT